MEFFKTLRATVGGWAMRLDIPAKYIHPLFTFQWGCGTVERHDYTHVDGTLLRGKHDGSLYQNGIVFVRVMLPFYVGIMVRWSGDPTVRRQYLQCHAGWKLNGNFAITFRIQCDASSELGTTGPNWGQAKGWSCGPH